MDTMHVQRVSADLMAARVGLRVIDGLRGRRLSILIFHRVLPQQDPIFPAEMHAARFDKLLSRVARAFQVLPLDQAVRRLDEGSLPRRALSITFDDGYADNHDVALPLLRKHGLTACFFVATGFLDGGRMFNDTVIEAVRRVPHASVDLEAFDLAQVEVATPAQKAAAIARVLPKVKYAAPAAREPLLRELVRACGTGPLPDDLMMSRAQVCAMRQAGMAIGAHTRQHPILATLSDDESSAEIAGGRDDLQQLLGERVGLFAYPNGRPNRDYEDRHVAIVAKLGFDAAVTTAAGVARPGADLYQLPRFTPWDTGDLRWTARLVAARARDAFEKADRSMPGGAPSLRETST